MIEADNYHALQLLEYLYAGKVDCIYIDPPYNTGAKDWKYNNDYVDGNDSYRHSKWLSMMQKRLKLAKRLLNPKDSVLIVTIDEKEYLHLGCLLEELQESPNLFYPVWVNEKAKKIEAVGDPLPLSVDRHDVEKKPPKPGLRAVWPIRTDNTEGRWQLGFDTLKNYLEQGIAKLGSYNKKRDQWAIVFLKKKQKEQLANGAIIAKGRDSDGSLILEWNENVEQDREPKTMWVRDWHDASTYGTNLIDKIIPKRDFAFPKSLYAVQDTIRFFVFNKPSALIVDFFAGSGTTLQAVNLLNVEDGGQRRCIMVTNNEVSVEEAKILTAKGLHPGDEAWDKLGIARYVTWPRTVCSIEGHDINGSPLKGNYVGNNQPMADGFKANAVFFKLGFLDKTTVSLGRQFQELLPVIWMKAGAIGPCPSLDVEQLPAMMILSKNKFAVLLDENYFSEFEEKVNHDSRIETVSFVCEILVKSLPADMKNLAVKGNISC